MASSIITPLTTTAEKKQKAVSQWFASHPSNNDPEVYLPEWDTRIRNWVQEKQAPGAPSLPPNLHKNLQEIEFSSFFVVYPIAGISLWNLLEALYKLDEIVCHSEDEVSQWKNLKPFEYLYSHSAEVMSKWKQSLKSLREKLLHSAQKGEMVGLTKEDLMLRMYNLRCAVDHLEVTWMELQANWGKNLKEVETQTMLKYINDSVIERFSTLEHFMDLKGEMKGDQNNEESAGSSDEQKNRDDSWPSPGIARADSIKNKLEYILESHRNGYIISASILAAVAILITLGITVA